MPFHPFVWGILDHFKIVPFQLTPNSYKIVIVIYIAFREFNLGELSMIKFECAYSLKKRKIKSTYYILKRTSIEDGIIEYPNNMGTWPLKYVFIEYDREC